MTEARDRVSIGGLLVGVDLANFVQDELLQGTPLDADTFWRSFQGLLSNLALRNKDLLRVRDEFQKQIDAWLRQNPHHVLDQHLHERFLREINYITSAPSEFSVSTSRVDDEICRVAGPQLVVPLDNARYALNAANARWGSLFDALYGTDAIAHDNGRHAGTRYNPARGQAVFDKAFDFLDLCAPLDGVSHREIVEYRTSGGTCLSLAAVDNNGRQHSLQDPEQFRGYRNHNDLLSCILLRHHGLHVEILIDRNHSIGTTHPAGVRDVVLESAVTTIQDCEDSVAAVDAADKCKVYRNWLGLMTGKLQAHFEKSGKPQTRHLEVNRTYFSPSGDEIALPGTSLQMVRNVGLHMYTDAVLDEHRNLVPEGFLDAYITVAAAKRNFDLGSRSGHQNSRYGSIYIVKPKLHGPDEVEFTVTLLEQVERALGLDFGTVKLGLMDEERRTSLNLGSCIHRARDRLIFINTGFLDRTGDEIHSLMYAGTFVPKDEIKRAHWLNAYEDWNVKTGLECGLSGRAQIGKGMWAKPDAMADMLKEKLAHPKSGATTAWVPSPAAATLHAMHYHMVDVFRQHIDASISNRGVELSDLLVPSLINGSISLSSNEISSELRNNIQGILGYVSRWIGQGIGCSKVPDIHGTALMEDRATLRISSQHIANWLKHGIVYPAQVEAVFLEMARLVDAQNCGDQGYVPMGPAYSNSLAFEAGRQLVFNGAFSPNGYTESILHHFRRLAKRRQKSNEFLEH